MMNKAVFLDRDGVINEDVGFLHRVEDIIFFPQAPEAFQKLVGSDYKIIIVTNQAGIARGYYTEKQYKKFESDYFRELAKFAKKIRIDGIYHCPHHPTAGKGKYKKECDCRKPKPGMFLQAQKDFNLDLKKSWMIGDKQSDIIAGKTAGCKTILVKTGYAGTEEGEGGGGIIPDFYLSDLMEAVSLILKRKI